jgi:hypothetical protein
VRTAIPAPVGLFATARPASASPRFGAQLMAAPLRNSAIQEPNVVYPNRAAWIRIAPTHTFAKVRCVASAAALPCPIAHPGNRVSSKRETRQAFANPIALKTQSARSGNDACSLLGFLRANWKARVTLH